jgi:hypothetical protein
MEPIRVKINQYDIVEFSDYKGTLQITVGYMSKDGSWKPKFCKREFGKENWRDVPLRIELGSLSEAGATLARVADLVQESGSNGPDGDVPF